MPDGRQARFYNLGYPVMSVMKDLLILSYAIRYQPDLILWPLTLESMPYDKQLYPPLLQNNPQPARPAADGGLPHAAPAALAPLRCANGHPAGRHRDRMRPPGAVK